MNNYFLSTPLRALALVAVLAGCAEMADGSMEKASSGIPGAANTGGGGNYQSADAGATSGPASSGGTANKQTPTSGVAVDSDEGIGLKPGGAQDIAFFRMKLQQKLLPKSADLTLEGFLNEHDTQLPPAQKDRAITLHALAGVFQPPQGKPQAVIQLGLNSSKKLSEVKTSLALTVVIDRSGSMSGAKMANVKAGLHVMADSLPAGTRLAIVSFSSAVTTNYPAQVVAADAVSAVHAAIDGIAADGGTNLFDGLATGLAVCKQAEATFKLKRILFLSDGVATVGNTDKVAISGLAKQAALAGCSVSTVGVGSDFDLPLMTEMAQVGQGTAWFVQSAEHAKAVFVQDLETMLIAVAEKLWMQFSLAPGWQVLDIAGFDWVTANGIVSITGPKKPAGQPTDPPPPQVDPNTGKVAMPTLFASKKNGIVMVRLQPPADVDVSKLSSFLMSTVEYGYTIAQTGAKESFQVPVQVPGLSAVPDGGLFYFASPIVQRAWLLLHVGVDLIDACKLAEAGQSESAKAVLSQGAALLAAEIKLGGQPLAAVDTTSPNLNDADQLLADLKALLP